MLNDIYLKMLSFRLKFLAKYFCTSKDFLWKHILKYHLSKICSLGANSEIFLLRLLVTTYLHYLSFTKKCLAHGMQ